MSGEPVADPEQQNFADHSVIVPQHRLKTAVIRTNEPGNIPMDVLERAEAALASLEGEFSGWMQAECDRLDAACHTLKQNGPDKAALDGLFRASQDIKGDALTLGYPLAAPLAASLCRLLYHAPDPARIPLPLIERYVAAIRAIVRESICNPHEPTALEIVEQLGMLAEKFLAHELNDGYAAIAADAAPSLQAPEKTE